MGNFGWTEILFVLIIALIIFGPRKLPELGKSLGQSLAQFRRASEDFKRTWEVEVETEKRRLEAPPPAPVDSESPAVTTRIEEAPVSEFEPAASVSPPDDAATDLTASQENVTVAREAKRDWA